MVNLWHIGSEKLKADFSNFDTNHKIEYVSLFLDLSDAFKKLNEDLKV